MTTRSGLAIDLSDFREDAVGIEDIAHGLALCNRFAGQTREPISVAQHSLYVAEVLAGTSHERQALLHDASEAYIGDMTKWLKLSEPMHGFRSLEATIQGAVYSRYGLPAEDAPEVKIADWLLVRYEGLRGYGPAWKLGDAGHQPPTPEEIERLDSFFGGWEFWSWRKARDLFLARFYRLFPEMS